MVVSATYQNSSVSHGVPNILDTLGLPVLKVVGEGESANLQELLHDVGPVGCEVNLRMELKSVDVCFVVG